MKFQKCDFDSPRQRGKIVYDLIKHNESRGLTHPDVIILGATDTDFQMAVNSQSLLIRCDWSKKIGERIPRYGVPFRETAALPIVIELLESKQPWFYQNESADLNLYVLTNAGTYTERDQQVIRLIDTLRGCLKNGSPKYVKAFKLHFLSSLYATTAFREVDIWGYYPSSTSNNREEEIMADFAKTAREMFKKRAAPPLFIRHQPSVQRHIVRGNREDPTSQLETIHLNSHYRGKLENKVVAVLDDYITCGVSFGVSTALLKAAGARKVICMAMGKFGSVSNRYIINLDSANIYAPMNTSRINYTAIRLSGPSSPQAHLEFVRKFKMIM